MSKLDRIKYQILINAPKIDKVMDRVINEIGITKGFAIYKKAIMAAGNLAKKGIQAELQKISGKFTKNKKHGLKYGRTGALAKSIKSMFRTNKGGLYSYAVVGTDRNFSASASRGRVMADVVPGNYVHLVNNGFVAVSRVSGVVGRARGYQAVHALRTVGSALKIERARTLSMRRLLGHKLDAFYADRAHDDNKQSNLQYIKAYKQATKTNVRGRHFMEAAAARFGPEGVRLAMSIMQTEFDKVISSMGAK